MDKGEFARLGNNQMLACDPASGEVRRFLTGPVGCEITGAALTPDGRTMFVNIQHPGETPGDRSDPGSRRSTRNWPDGPGAARPRSATVVIRKADGGVIGSGRAAGEAAALLEAGAAPPESRCAPASRHVLRVAVARLGDHVVLRHLLRRVHTDLSPRAGLRLRDAVGERMRRRPGSSPSTAPACRTASDLAIRALMPSRWR